MDDVRKFSGRGTDQPLTEFINARILKELAIEPGDRVVDVGCGDGTLLRLAISQGAEVVGLSGSQEETVALQKLGLNVSHAYSRSLPIPDKAASIVVCNGVLHIVPPNEIPTSLREIARVSRNGARIWIGELPRFREPASIREFPSYWAMLWWLLRERGPRTFLGMGRRILTGTQREPVLRTAQSFWSDPENFIKMASAAGLTIERHFPHRTLDANRQPTESPTRQDYILRSTAS